MQKKVGPLITNCAANVRRTARNRPLVGAAVKKVFFWFDIVKNDINCINSY